MITQEFYEKCRRKRLKIETYIRVESEDDIFTLQMTIIFIQSIFTQVKED